MRTSSTAIMAIVLILVTLGIIMLASTSAVQADATYKDSAYFIKRQIFALVVGVAAFIACMHIPYHHWKALAPFVAVCALILLVMAVIPGVGISVKGSSRWLKLGPITIQPSELGKFAMIAAMALWLSHAQRTIHTFKNGMLIPCIILGMFAFLIFIEPDFGTTMLVSLVGLSMMFVAGTRISYLSITAVLGLSGFVFAVFKNEVRMNRVLAFLNPEKFAQNEAFQLLHAIYAFVLGGFGGAGLGESLQKRFYLPEAHTDFIFAIMGEELGLLASIGVVLLFTALFGVGLLISFKTSDIFGRLLAFGITLMISLQAAINIAVVTGCMPTKGLPLPLISYGGTSLVTTLAMIGVLVNVAHQTAEESDPISSNRTRHTRV